MPVREKTTVMKTESAELGLLVPTADFRFVTTESVAGGGSAVHLSNQRMFSGIARYIIQRTQLEEAHITAALGRAGRELIASRGTAMILSRLCRLMIEILGCECSHTFVWQPRENAYVAVSGSGDMTAQWASIRTLRLPRPRVSRLLARLNRQGCVQVMQPRSQDLLPAMLLEQCGLRVCLYVGLRRGADLIGFQTAGYRCWVEPFTMQQQRIAVGVAGLASMALEHARLAETLAYANRLKAEFTAAMSSSLRRPTLCRARAARRGGRRQPHPRRRAPAYPGS